MLVFGQGYEKKIQSETLKKSQFLFFSENPTFCGSNFVLWVRGGRFQNFDTRIGSYSQKRSKLLIFYEIPKAYHKIANHPVHCILSQGALYTWRGRLQHFLQLLSYWNFQKMIVIWFVHLQKSNKFPEFQGCGSKITSSMPS